MSFALDVFFSYWTGWWFSQIFSTLDHFHVLLNSQPRDLWRTPPNISGCSLSFGAQSKLPTPQFLDSNTLMLARYHCCTRCFSVLWRRPIVLWGASDSALFVVSGFRPRNGDSSKRTQEMALTQWVNETFTDNYFHLLDRRDGDKCWKAFNETSKTLKVESRSVCQDMSTWCPMILGPEGHSLKYIRVRSSTVIVLWFHDIDQYTMNFKALPELEWSLTCLLLNYIYLIYFGIWE